MKILKTLISIFLVVGFPCTVIAQSQVLLICKGEIKTTTDGSFRSQFTSNEVRLNLENSTIEIHGYWGCLASYGEALTSPLMPSKCRGSLPVEIKEDEIKFSAFSDGEKYSGSTTFTLNRYIGSWNIQSIAFAKPASGAKWKYQDISAELFCIVPEKKF